MPKWLRAAVAIAVGCVDWFVVATCGNLAFRLVVPGYADAEKAMNFSIAMRLLRLMLGAASSLLSGGACAAIAGSAGYPVYGLALLLLALFVPVHLNLWTAFPVWYHLLFLGTLAPLALLGARLPNRRGSRPAKL